MLGLAALVILGLTIPLKTQSDVQVAPQIQETPLSSLPSQPNEVQIKQAIEYVANNNGISSEKMIALANCESGFKDICITDTNGKLSCGIFMFQEKTLKGYCPDLSWGKGYIKDSILCAAKVLSHIPMSVDWTVCSYKIVK